MPDEPVQLTEPRRCLIVERHDWETGANRHQLQFPLDVANDFFGPEEVDRQITLRIFLDPSADEPDLIQAATISHTYEPSRSRRLNRLPLMGSILSAFIFFEETGEADVYDFWWRMEKTIVAAQFHPWSQARGNQYNRGRLAIILPAPVPRTFSQVF